MHGRTFSTYCLNVKSSVVVLFLWIGLNTEADVNLVSEELTKNFEIGEHDRVTCKLRGFQRQGGVQQGWGRCRVVGLCLKQTLAHIWPIKHWMPNKDRAWMA